MPEVVVEMVIHHALESPISSSGLLEIVSAVRTNLSGSQRGASASCGKTQTCPRPQISTGSGLYHFSTSGSFQKTLGLIVCALKFQNRCVIERAHQTLKHQLQKLKKGELYLITPSNSLNHASFVLNFLQLDISGHSTTQRFWNFDAQTIRPKVF